ncbi:GerMN domain-containing protein [Salicibibacter cibarius]|uniref:GerMN domain-containing protein n=1 Tax=Salicibibacter cibarius TaxID=2743000 RepID=A0A7T6Z1F0_9BACI|nr:GerMN domain-containing protein [Salicibibacter cibarius]QQK75205.1 GerMN domain-containing protein [Salicibibacter cibarius]
MKRPLIFAVTATMAITLAACNDAEDDSAGDNDQELPEEETEEETDDDSDIGEEPVEEPENGENGSEEASDGDTGTENGTEEEGAEEDGAEEENGAENEDGTATEDIDLLFYDDEALNMYRESHTVSADSTEELPVAAVEEWLNGPESDELTTLLSDEGVHVQYLEDQEGTAHISFSPEITDANFGSSAEIAFLDQVAHIMIQFGYDSTQFLLDGEIEESLLGHIDTSEPYTPDDSLDSYEEIDG